MPKKPKKTREESFAEDYFPMGKENQDYTIEKKEKPAISKEDNFKKTIEVPIKKIISEEVIKGSIEKEYKKPKRESLISSEKTKKKSAKKPGRRNFFKKTEIKYDVPDIKLKKDGYEMIITEKPQAALKISSALGKSTKRNFKGVPYYEVNRQGKKIVVACAVGHLFSLKQKSSGSKVPTFDIGWFPNYLVRKGDFTKKYYEGILNLTKNAGSLIVATDYDIEGELIGFNIIKYICNQKDASRMKFSTLTDKELNVAYEEKSSKINWGQAIAGETRHYLDWFYGINLSRALMNSIKTTGSFRIMSIGRVQGPALNLIVQKEREIQKFKSEPYWQVFIKVKNSHEVELKYNKDIFDKNELKKFEGILGKTAKAETKKSEQIVPPNPPFNLTNLQTEAYKFYGITPSNTLKAAQNLYLAGLISYPRTSSQKLPDSIEYQTILNGLSKEYRVEDLITRKKPVEGKKTDPAHPSIYPTGNKQILSGYDEKIYDLIVRRFLSLFCDDAIIDNKTILAILGNLEFSTRGSWIRKKGWMSVYPTKLAEKEIPDVNGNVKIIDVRTEEKETQPPRRYSPASIISELEKRNLGTKATRSSILETLYDRGYIKEKSIEATPFGMSLISTLEKYSPIIIDEKLTRSFEQQMDSIVHAKKEFEEKENKIINKAKETINEIAKHFEKHEKSIGKELLNANIEQIEQERIANKLLQCPVCKRGMLEIKYSKKTRRYFVACDKYPECKTTYSLPPNGLIKKSEQICEECHFPMLMLISSGRRPWTFCFNRECPTNKKRLEEYQKKKDEENFSKLPKVL